MGCVMSSLLEYYKLLDVSAGAGIADITSSYRRLCRIYHPDVSDDPKSEELMKRINVAYTALREKLWRESALRERAFTARPRSRYTAQDTSAAAHASAKERAERTRNAGKEAYAALYGYFKAISGYDYAAAYEYLSSYDRRRITQEGFAGWRGSVARLFPMRGFKISGGPVGTALKFNDGKTIYARKYRVDVVEEHLPDGKMQSEEVEKLVISENGVWRVFLGYKNIGELARTFDERFEAKQKQDIAKNWDEYYAGLYPEYNMFSIGGLRKAVSREIYRQKRFGGTLAFAAISVNPSSSARGAASEALIRSAAKTINGMLRETDVPAYAGDGVFALLLVGLRKRDAADVLRRLVGRIRDEAGPQLGEKADIDFAYGTYQDPASLHDLNKVLERFHKKLSRFSKK